MVDLARRDGGDEPAARHVSDLDSEHVPQRTVHKPRLKRHRLRRLGRDS